MFKNYKDISDVVSLLAYCPSERSFLLTKEANGDIWLPAVKCEKNSWKSTALKINFELFGTDAIQCTMLRVYRVWLPSHPQPCAYHAIYKVLVKPDLKKKTKLKMGSRHRLQWLNSVELDRQRAHLALRSPEVTTFALLAMGEQPRDQDGNAPELDNSNDLIELWEENVVVSADAAAGAVALASQNHQLVQAANYTKEDQIRMYREFLVMVFPAMFMSPQVFSQFMVDIGWPQPQCSNLFRAADVSCRGGLSFLDMLLWNAATEPGIQHSGIPAEIRCRYIFRFFDNNRDTKLEYVEFKELVASTRQARQLPVDALSVARDADVCLRQLGIQPNAQLPLAEFVRGVIELRLRGTSALLRSPKSVAAYLLDLQQQLTEITPSVNEKKLALVNTAALTPDIKVADGVGVGSALRWERPEQTEYSVARYTVRLHRRGPPELQDLTHFDELAVSGSASLLAGGGARSLELLGPDAKPAEALAAVHYFATATEKIASKSSSTNGSITKAAYSWANPSEEMALGALLLHLAEGVRAICANEPRLLRLNSPIYAIGDLHGNLPALLAMESALWASGPSLSPARILFLGDYVDRGAYGTELLAYLFAAKLQRPNAVFMIRGNHETREIQNMFTFHTECLSKYGEVEGTKIWNAVNQVFDVLPLAAVVDNKVFCCHGGIPPPWLCPLVSAIDKVPNPLPRPDQQSALAWELLWNDPVKGGKVGAALALQLAGGEGFANNARRGTGHVFDASALSRFLQANRLNLVLRAHELHPRGFMCQLGGRLVSVFSSSHYCGGNNDCGVALLDGSKLRLIRVNGDN